jgi:hypothetical protein
LAQFKCLNLADLNHKVLNFPACFQDIEGLNIFLNPSNFT